jgi:hypothetical protein
MAHSGMSCSRVACSEPVVTTLGPEDFCFDHFCSRSYELLELADHGMAGTAGLAGALCMLEECARRALEISLSDIALTNLDRARLLDIVLWSGDLTTVLRRKLRATAPRIEEQGSRSELMADTARNSGLN